MSAQSHIGTIRGRRRMRSGRHLRRLSDVRRRQAEDQNVVDLDGDLNSSESSVCIDLTSDDAEDVIDLTSVIDSPVVVLRASDAIPSGLRERSTQHRRRRMSLRQHIYARYDQTPVGPSSRRATQRMTENNDDDDSSVVEELPPFDVSGTPYRPDGEGTSADSMISPPPVKLTCPICMDDDKQIKRSGRQLASTVCGHLFCSHCIRRSVQTQHECPSCRKKLTLRQIHALYI